MDSDILDLLIIGAGLTGAAAAYHLRNSGRSVVLLDRGDPAGEASGRNGGNFELLPENSVGIYEGLAPGRLAFMKRRYPRVPEEVLRAVSERQASLVLGLALRNRDILKETILSERIACDFLPGVGCISRPTKEKSREFAMRYRLPRSMASASRYGRVAKFGRNSVSTHRSSADLFPATAHTIRLNSSAASWKARFARASCCSRVRKSCASSRRGQTPIGSRLIVELSLRDA